MMTSRRNKAAANYRAPANKKPPGSQKGMALVLVLWLVVLLSVLATGHARNVHTETSLVSWQMETAQARALAEAGAQRAILDLMSGAARQWSANGTINSFKFDDHDISIAIRDATGLIDLNSANSELLGALISAAGPDQITRQRIVDAILDWRDADDLTHLYGAEDDDYRAAGLTWSARDGAFASVDELLYVMGMTRDIFDRVSPYLTIYSERSSVDLEYAPAFLISALTGQEIEVREDVAAARSQAIGQSGSGTFHIYVSASVGDGTNFSLETVVRLLSDPERPFAVLYWREPMRTPLTTSEGDRT
jgi:general secretion pathway protein K